MLKNDEVFWKPEGEVTAVTLSWGGSGGQFDRLWELSKRRWEHTLKVLRQDAELPLPSGKIVEFGSGMGLLDDLIDDDLSELLMLDVTKGYIEERTHPLTSRCRHVLFKPETLTELQCSESESFDWLICIAVFYHLDEVTAVALIAELGKLIKPGGYVLIRDWNELTIEALREVATVDRLFSSYPRYFIDTARVGAALALGFTEAYRGKEVLVYQKRSGE